MRCPLPSVSKTACMGTRTFPNTRGDSGPNIDAEIPGRFGHDILGVGLRLNMSDRFGRAHNPGGSTGFLYPYDHGGISTGSARCAKFT